MDEQQQPSSLAAAFPAPPPFWQSFTPENLTQITSLRAAQSLVSTKTDPAKELPIRLLDLPAELRCLQPPEPPAEGIYRCFGALYNVSWRLKGEHTLERQGCGNGVLIHGTTDGGSSPFVGGTRYSAALHTTCDTDWQRETRRSLSDPQKNIEISAAKLSRIGGNHECGS